MYRQQKFKLVDKDRMSLYEYQKRDSVYIRIGMLLCIVAIVLAIFVWNNLYALTSALFTSLFIGCFILIEMDNTRGGVNAIFIATKGRDPNIEYSFVIGTALIYWAINTFTLSVMDKSGFLIGYLVFELIICIDYEHNREKDNGYGFWIVIGGIWYTFSCFLGSALGYLVYAIQTQ